MENMVNPMMNVSFEGMAPPSSADQVSVTQLWPLIGDTSDFNPAMGNYYCNEELSRFDDIQEMNGMTNIEDITIHDMDHVYHPATEELSRFGNIPDMNGMSNIDDININDMNRHVYHPATDDIHEMSGMGTVNNISSGMNHVYPHPASAQLLSNEVYFFLVQSDVIQCNRWIYLRRF